MEAIRSHTPRPLVILGAGAYAEEVADLVSDMGTYTLKAFIEGVDRTKVGQRLYGVPICWIDEVIDFEPSIQAVCAVGSTERKGFIQQALDADLQFTSIVHPTAHISATSTIGVGSIIGARTIIAAHTTIGQHVIINRGAMIGHHTCIGDYVTVGPGANVAGKVHVAEGAYIAMGSTVLDRKAVGCRALVGAGAVVTRSVAERDFVVGIPARSKKEK